MYIGQTVIWKKKGHLVRVICRSQFKLWNNTIDVFVGQLVVVDRFDL